VLQVAATHVFPELSHEAIEQFLVNPAQAGRSPIKPSEGQKPRSRVAVLDDSRVR
jgi:hypothetical protein